MVTIPKKKSGRPAKFSEELQAQIAQLYYDDGLTARAIREMPEFQTIRSDQALRAIASRQRHRELKRASA